MTVESIPQLILFKDTTWEIEKNGPNEITCYNRTIFKIPSNASTLKQNEDEDFNDVTGVFGYEEWKAFNEQDLLRTDHPIEALPIIYYATQILGYPNIERIRNTKYRFFSI